MKAARLIAALLALFLLLTPASAFSSETTFQGHAITIPSGWTLVPQPELDCPMGRREAITLRNEAGTIWIFVSPLSEDELSQIGQSPQRLTLEETDTSSGLPFSTYSFPPNGSTRKAPAIIFPTLHLAFSLSFTVNGKKDPAEMLKWLTPPTGEEWDHHLQTAKSLIFTIVNNMATSSKAPTAEAAPEPTP
jgi:hypothetical protein